MSQSQSAIISRVGLRIIDVMAGYYRNIYHFPDSFCQIPEYTPQC